MAFLGQGEFSSRESEGLLVCRGIVHGVIVGVPPDGSFPVLSVWSPSCHKRPGSGCAGWLAGSGWVFEQRGEGWWHHSSGEQCQCWQQVDGIVGGLGWGVGWREWGRQC